MIAGSLPGGRDRVESHGQALLEARAHPQSCLAGLDQLPDAGGGSCSAGVGGLSVPHPAAGERDFGHSGLAGRRPLRRAPRPWGRSLPRAGAHGGTAGRGRRAGGRGILRPAWAVHAVRAVGVQTVDASLGQGLLPTHPAWPGLAWAGADGSRDEALLLGRRRSNRHCRARPPTRRVSGAAGLACSSGGRAASLSGAAVNAVPIVPAVCLGSPKRACCRQSALPSLRQARPDQAGQGRRPRSCSAPSSGRGTASARRGSRRRGPARVSLDEAHSVGREQRTW